MNEIKIRTNGIRPGNVVAEWNAQTTGGAGDRRVILGGFGMSEARAREQLLEQAKAMRNELNSAIEIMIGEMCAAVSRS